METTTGDRIEPSLQPTPPQPPPTPPLPPSQAGGNGKPPLPKPKASPPRAAASVEGHIPATIAEETEEDEREIETNDTLSKPLLAAKADKKNSPARARLLSWELDPRTVSPGGNVDSSSSAKTPSTPRSPPHIRLQGNVPRGTLTLEELMGHTPFEEEAEAYLQTSLEEADPTRIIRPVASGLSSKSILMDDTSLATFQVLPEHAQQRRPSVFSNRTHRKVASTAEELYNLTRTMQQLDGRLPPSDASAASDDVEAVTNAHTLAANARGILKHRKAPEEISDQRSVQGDAAAASTDGGAELTLADRMALLRNLAVGSVGSKKSIVSRVPDPAESELVDMAAVKDCKNSLSASSSSHTSHPDRDGEADGGEVNAESEHPPQSALRVTVTEYQSFEDWFRFERVGILTFFKGALIYCMIPSTLIAAILFYAAGNPPCNQQLQCSPKDTSDPTLVYLGSASASWWLLFLCCRQVITLMLARVTEDVIVDYLALRTNWAVRLFGPLFTLFLIQARGWPCVLFFWGVFDLILLFGKHNFAQNWLFYQDFVGLMNGQNPSGNIPSSNFYQFIVIAAMVVSFVVAVKRIWLGLVLGRVTFQRYSEELTKVMAGAVLVGKVANLARDIERANLQFDPFELPGTSYSLDEEDPQKQPGSSPKSAATSTAGRRNVFADLGESSTRKAKIDEILGEWEEPEAQREIEEKPTIASIIQFRQSTAYLNTSLPFGVAFGGATTRQEVIESTEALYNRLMASLPGRDILTFDVFALLAVKEDGELDMDTLRQLIKTFRPDREGNLSLLDFAKAIDKCYKEMRVLRASIYNSSQMDHSFEGFFNFFFYIAVAFIVLAVAGFDPFVLWASVSGFVISMSFIIGGGCSAYFQGLMMVFLRRPFDIGDKIATSQPYTDTSTTGSSYWIVKHMNLYSTTVVYSSTAEVATYSNGALSTLRIINATRSPQASLSFYLQFGIETPFTKIQLFKAAIEKFVKARPREWVRFSSFRVYAVEADLGYVQYSVGAVHRESWQNGVAISNSKADLQAFANELAKQMDMRYVAPPMPVDLLLRHAESTGPNMPQQGPIGSRGSPVPQSEVRAGDGIGAAHSVAAMFGTELSP